MQKSANNVSLYLYLCILIAYLTTNFYVYIQKNYKI